MILPPSSGKFPWAPVIGSAFAIFTNNYALTNLFPYVGFMVVDLGKAENTDSSGYAAGLLTAAFMISRGLTSLPWGWASDKYGRRPVLLIGCFSMFVFQLWFGFSRTFSSAICARAALGAFNGLVGTAKTVAGEVTQGHGAEAASRSMGYVSAGVLLGMIGPSMGGWLSDPPSQRSNSTSLLAEYPYALPNVVGSAFALLSGIIYFLLPETKRNEYSHVELTAIDNDNDAENDGNVPTASVPPKSRVISSLVLQSCTVYAVHSFCAIWLNEIFPLWCIASVDSGGLGLDLDEVGSILSASGIAVHVYQVFLF